MSGGIEFTGFEGKKIFVAVPQFVESSLSAEFLSDFFINNFHKKNKVNCDAKVVFTSRQSGRKSYTNQIQIYVSDTKDNASPLNLGKDGFQYSQFTMISRYLIHYTTVFRSLTPPTMVKNNFDLFGKVQQFDCSFSKNPLSNSLSSVEYQDGCDTDQKFIVSKGIDFQLTYTASAKKMSTDKITLKSIDAESVEITFLQGNGDGKVKFERFGGNTGILLSYGKRKVMIVPSKGISLQKGWEKDLIISMKSSEGTKKLNIIN